MQGRSALSRSLKAYCLAGALLYVSAMIRWFAPLFCLMVLLGRQQVSAGDLVSLSTNPQLVCVDSHGNRYLNFDLVVHNPTAGPLRIAEIKAKSFDVSGQLIE